MRVVGLDLSLTASGLSDGRVCTVAGSPPAGQGLHERYERIEELATRVLRWVIGDPIDLVVIEMPNLGGSSGRGSFVLERSAFWWTCVGALIDRKVPVAEVTASSLKLYATGKGNAGKGAMIDAASRRLPEVETLGDDNRVDALWLAAMGYDHLGAPLCALPATHRRALDAVRWPALEMLAAGQ